MIGESLKLNRKWNFLIVADGKLGRNYSRRMSIWASLIILNRSSSWERLIFLLDKQIVQVYSSNQGYRASILERDGRWPIDIFVTQSTAFLAEISNCINWEHVYYSIQHWRTWRQPHQDIFCSGVMTTIQRSLPSWGIFDEKSRGREPSESKPWNLLVMCAICCALV
jgi:hypothetical protein